MIETPPKLVDVLALERTHMAADRTLRGGIRTALSMIGSGFTIFLFLDSIRHSELAAGAAQVIRCPNAVFIAITPMSRPGGKAKTGRARSMKVMSRLLF